MPRRNKVEYYWKNILQSVQNNWSLFYSDIIFLPVPWTSPILSVLCWVYLVVIWKSPHWICSDYTAVETVEKQNWNGLPSIMWLSQYRKKNYLVEVFDSGMEKMWQKYAEMPFLVCILQNEFWKSKLLAQVCQVLSKLPLLHSLCI